MFIKAVVIEGVEGEVRIDRTDAGAVVTADGRVLCEMGRTEPPEARYAKAREVAKIVCGRITRASRFGDAVGDPAATNSMIHDVLTEIERVAGC